MEFLTADVVGAGMTSGGVLGQAPVLGAITGKFYLTVSGDRGTCKTGHLDNGENNWQRGKVRVRLLY